MGYYVIRVGTIRGLILTGQLELVKKDRRVTNYDGQVLSQAAAPQPAWLRLPAPPGGRSK